ncbi:hypothetical protein, partial [Streptomyces alkaliphilus]|uniref:hypothetical protein n=1 Tax=Streptomyces alkaliphilus TaxID=1472722 RepID=UPI001E292B13
MHPGPAQLLTTADAADTVPPLTAHRQLLAGPARPAGPVPYSPPTEDTDGRTVDTDTTGRDR